MAFLAAFLAATAALLVTGVIPMRFAGTVIAWIVVATAAWWYVRASAGHLRTLPQPAGYAMAMGALLGVSVQIAAFVLRFSYNLAVAHRALPPGGWGLAGFAIAAITGAVLAAAFGTLGGLIAAWQIPKALQTSHASLIVAGIAAGVALLLGGGAVLYVVALARAMSDVPN